MKKNFYRPVFRTGASKSIKRIVKKNPPVGLGVGYPEEWREGKVGEAREKVEMGEGRREKNKTEQWGGRGWFGK